MTFDPLELMTVADTLDKSTEAGCRTAINRAYYAMFLKARDHLAKNDLINVQGAAQDHGQVLQALRDNRRGNAAIQLASLRTRRNRADYDTSTEVRHSEAAEALALANQIRQLLARDWNAPA